MASEKWMVSEGHVESEREMSGWRMKNEWSVKKGLRVLQNEGSAIYDSYMDGLFQE